MKSYYSLGDLIDRLEREPDHEVPVGFDNPHSYRGYYEQLAFEPRANTTVGAMLTAARSADGATFTGWKGGKYVMDRDTECWISYRGMAGADKLGEMLVEFMLGHIPDVSEDRR